MWASARPIAETWPILGNLYSLELREEGPVRRGLELERLEMVASRVLGENSYRKKKIRIARKQGLLIKF